jgi:hypothetical protein
VNERRKRRGAYSAHTETSKARLKLAQVLQQQKPAKKIQAKNSSSTITNFKQKKFVDNKRTEDDQ